MPQFNDPNSLSALLRLQSINNVSGPRSQRELDLAGGLGGFEPSELELKMLQRDATDQFTTPSGEAPVGAVPWALGGGGSAVRGTSHIPGGSYTPSREELRDMLMGGVKKDLMFGDIAHQQKMQQALIPKQLEGEYGLREADIKGRYDVEAEHAGELGALQRLLISQGGMNERSAASNEAAMNRTTANNESRRAIAELIQKMITERQQGGGFEWGDLFNFLSGGSDEAPVPETTEMMGDANAETIPTPSRRRLLSVE